MSFLITGVQLEGKNDSHELSVLVTDDEDDDIVSHCD
jgi:hypothetical protein